MTASETYPAAWLIELDAAADGVERTWVTDNLHRPLLEAILTVPHMVALLPLEFAKDLAGLDDLLPRLGGALMILVEDRSPQVAAVLAAR